MSAVESSVVDPLRLCAVDVTGTRSVELEGVDGHRLAGEVAMSLAAEMSLPTNTPFALRDDDRAKMLTDDVPIGEQVEREDANVVVVPKSHLGVL